MTRDERCQMDYIIYCPHRADMHTQRGSYYQFRPFEWCLSRPDRISCQPLAEV